MKKRLALALSISMIAILITASLAFAAASKQDVCHLDKDTGTYILINISENAFQAHLDHGDAAPGDEAGEAGYIFGGDCAVVARGVTGTWVGTTGQTTGDSTKWQFVMTLVQDSLGNVTGYIDYTNTPSPVHRLVDGQISGNLLTIRQDDGGYWADCEACVVSLDGTSFHGHGADSGHTTDHNFVEWNATKQ